METTSNTYKVGDTIETKNAFGQFEWVVIERRSGDVKDGRPGYTGTNDEGRQVWGYDSEILRITKEAK